MPYEWLPPTSTEFRLHVWPYRSLPKRGFVWFIGLTAALIAVPVLPHIGSPVVWGLLPFILLTLAGAYWALQRSYRDGEIVEDLTLTRDLITLHRHNPRAADQVWQANPHWVRATLHPTGGPVPQYLTLSGNGREVELGAFLTPQERRELYDLLLKHLTALRMAPPPP